MKKETHLSNDVNGIYDTKLNNSSRYYVADVKEITGEELKDENLIFCPYQISYVDGRSKQYDEFMKEYNAT